MRKRLIELIAESAIKGDYTYIPDVADYLIANGVTIKGEWINADERLPEVFDDVLVYDGAVTVDHISSDGQWYYHNHDAVTYWMPLPEPPKTKGGE